MSSRSITLLAIGLMALLGAAPAWAGTGIGGNSITDYIRALWPIAVTGVGLLGAGVLLGLGTRFPSAAAFHRLKDRVGELEDNDIRQDARLDRFEEYCRTTPTRQDLQEDIAELGERMRGVEVEMGGMKDQLRTTNTYLHTLLERGLSGK